MKYIVFDLEFNQPFDFKEGDKTFLDPRIPFEIIQIGAVKLDEDMKIVDQKSFMIRPQIYKRLHPYVEKMTGFKMEQLETGEPFQEAFQAFQDFIGKGGYVLCIWGDYDIHALYKNVFYYDLYDDSLSRRFINVQKAASITLGYGGGAPIGLQKAVQAMDISIDGAFHDALNDALYTAKIFQLIRRKHAPVEKVKAKQIKRIKEDSKCSG